MEDQKTFYKKNSIKYDLGMSYIEGLPVYYLAEFIDAKIKIARIPTDYASARLDQTFDLHYFKQMDYLFSITEGTAKILKDSFPALEDKMKVFDLITSRKLINLKANEKFGFSDKFDGIRILTLSRLDNTKGTDLAIEACRKLKEDGIKFKWYIMGNGDRLKYINRVLELDVKDNLIFMNPESNPFPF